MTPPVPPPPADRGVFTATRWILRVGLFLQAAMAVTQPILAGLYLSGNLDAIDIHSIIGGSLTAVTFVVLLLAVAHWLIGRGPLWPVGALAVLTIAVVTQATAGYSRTLGLHIPLGVTVVGTCVVLFGWSVFGKDQPRPRRAFPPAPAAADQQPLGHEPADQQPAGPEPAGQGTAGQEPAGQGTAP